MKSLEYPLTFLPQWLIRFIFPVLVFVKTHRLSLLQLALVSGVLFTAPLAGIFVIKINPIIIFVALVLPIIFIVINTVLPRSELGPIIILFAAALLPISLSTGTESRLVDSLLLTILFTGHWLLRIIIVDKQGQFKPSPANKPLLFFVITVLVSTIWSILLRDPLVTIWKSFPFVQIGSAITMVMLPAAFWLVANHINNIKHLKIMVVIMLIVSVIGGITRGLNLDLPDTLQVNTGGLFSMWIVGISFGLVMFIRNLPWLVKAGLLIQGTLWVYLRFFLGVSWLAGWLPLIIMLGVLLYMRSKKLLALMAVIGFIYVQLNSNYYLGTVLENETNESGNTRMDAWEVNWRVTGKHLLFGTGPAGYAVYYMSYYPDEGMATHNSLIDTLAQTGIVGLFFIIWFFVALIGQGYKVCLRVKGRGDFTEAMAMIALGGTVGTMIMAGFGDWLFPFAYTQTIAGFDYVVYSWLFMGVIIVIDQLTLEDTPTAVVLAYE